MDKRKGAKKLIVEITEELHKEIKTRALNRNITMKIFTIQALLEKIAHEKVYE